MEIKLLVEGGAMKPGPAISQQLGPAGINMGKVISDVNDATSGFKGLKVPVTLEVDTKLKTFEIKVFSPPVSELLKKQLGLEKGAGEQKKIQAGNASIEDIISVAKTKLPNLLCKDLKAAVKTIAGTCVSLGLLIENQPAVKIASEVEAGKYDNEIQEQKTETDAEKRKQLDSYFKDLHSAQEKQKKEEEEAAAEAEKEAAAAAEPKEGEAAPTAPTAEGEAPAPPAATEEKK
ncbi:50S ribosomal protein L11 [archaeon]|jgi:large subunit ribosomal protein L11|nr:50S ribosomal protein L11 [archaeon]MBT4373219.1 50S ribosomal protein L11 [archaeon]MBT4531564.1 50S ribosomal protein L11 [archaeon]MBT7001258.1 50S ribosomal protein L11 [archaeon]MBT7282256.1 50S ribosomal protein L11 [archaeon]